LVTTLRQERDHLQLALSSELAHRRRLEEELDSLRIRLTGCERDLQETRLQRDRFEGDYRSANKRQSEDLNGSQLRLVEVET
jgi:chromosome segregation ATPase